MENIDQSNGSRDGLVDRVNPKSSSSIESNCEESEFVDGKDICVADEDIHTEEEVISLSFPTAVTTESGMIGLVDPGSRNIGVDHESGTWLRFHDSRAKCHFLSVGRRGESRFWGW